MDTIRLSQKSARLLREFDRATQKWGRDQSGINLARKTEQAYTESKNELGRHLVWLEKQISELRMKCSQKHIPLDPIQE